jgi:hypothetical protein
MPWLRWQVSADTTTLPAGYQLILAPQPWGWLPRERVETVVSPSAWVRVYAGEALCRDVSVQVSLPAAAHDLEAALDGLLTVLRWGALAVGAAALLYQLFSWVRAWHDSWGTVVFSIFLTTLLCFGGMIVLAFIAGNRQPKTLDSMFTSCQVTLPLQASLVGLNWLPVLLLLVSLAASGLAVYWIVRYGLFNR